MKDGDAAVDDDRTLYAMIVDLTGIAYDPDEGSVEAYKQQIVSWYSPEDRDEGDRRYEKATREVQDWVDDATKIARANKSARRKQPLPAIDGLNQEDEVESSQDDTDNRKTRTRRRADKPAANKGARTADKPKAARERAKANGEGRDPTNNCYGHVFRLVLKNPKSTLDQIKERLNRDGMDYSDVSVGRVYSRAHIFHKIAVEMGQIEA